MTPTPPRKRVPAKRQPPQTRSDDIREFEEAQAVMQVEREPGDEDYFPELDPARLQDDERLAERAPSIPTPTRARAQSIFERARNAMKPAPKRGRPKVVKPRVPVDTVISTAWGFAAKLVGSVDAPVGRVLALQSPVAGRILEERVKNTVLDRMLQPLAHVSEGGDVALALIGPPVIIAALERKPEYGAMLVPMLRYTLMRWLQIAGPSFEKVAQEEAEFEEKYGQSVDAMIAFILGDTGVPVPNGSVPTAPGPGGSVPGMGHAAANGRTDTPAGVFRTTDH